MPQRNFAAKHEDFKSCSTTLPISTTSFITPLSVLKLNQAQTNEKCVISLCYNCNENFFL